MLSFLYLHRRLHIMFRFACLTLICGKLRYMIIETCNNWNYQNIIYPPLSYINDNYVYSHCFVDSYFQDILRQWINISYKIRSKLLQQNIIYFLILSLLFSVIATVSISHRHADVNTFPWGFDTSVYPFHLPPVSHPSLCSHTPWGDTPCTDICNVWKKGWWFRLVLDFASHGCTTHPPTSQYQNAVSDVRESKHSHEWLSGAVYSSSFISTSWTLLVTWVNLLVETHASQGSGMRYNRMNLYSMTKSSAQGQNMCNLLCLRHTKVCFPYFKS